MEQYEKELNQLNSAIDKYSQEVIKLNGVKKQVKRQIIFYGTVIYVAIVGYLILRLPANNGINWLRWFIVNQLKNQWAVLLGFPFCSYVVAKVLRSFLDLMIRSRDKYLKDSRKKQRAKISELKKITNFNATNDLVNKFEGKQEVKKYPDQEAITRAQLQKGQPQQQGQKGQPQPSQQAGQSAQGKAPFDPKVQMAKSSIPTPAPQPQVPEKKTILDRILDLLVGSDEGPQQRYALICKSCFNHCGLAPPGTEDMSSVKFICPFCKYFNGDDIDISLIKQMNTESTPVPETVPETVPVPESTPVPETVPESSPDTQSEHIKEPELGTDEEVQEQVDTKSKESEGI